MTAAKKIKPMTPSETLRRIGEPIFGLRGDEEAKAKIFLTRVKDAGLEETMALFALQRIRELMAENKSPSRFGLSQPQPSAKVVPNDSRVSSTAASFVRRTIYETITIRDRPIGEIRYCDIAGITNTNAYENALLKAIKDQYVPANPSATIKEFVPIKRLTELEGTLSKKYNRTS